MEQSFKQDREVLSDGGEEQAEQVLAIVKMEVGEEEEDKSKIQKRFTRFCVTGLAVYQNIYVGEIFYVMEMEVVSDRLKNSVPEHSRGMKILVVDDDVASLFHLTNMLQEYSYNVTPTTSTAYSLYELQEAKSPFKLVMASYSVLDMNSLSFLNTMHKKDIPVIFIFSKSNDDGDILKVLAEGAHSFLKKPIYPVHLKYVWQPASIKMLERQKKGIELQKNNNIEKAPLGITAEDSCREQQDRELRRKRSNSAKRHKTEERCIDERRSCSLPPVKISSATGAQPQLGMEERQQIQAQYGQSVGANQNTISVVPADDASNPNPPNLDQQGVLDQLSRVLLDQDTEESGLNMDPFLVDLYSRYFKS